MEDITKAEKAALYFQIIERCEDWKEIYKIAVGEKQYNTLSDKSKTASASRWKQSHKIQKAREEIEMIFKAQKKEIEEKAKQVVLSGETEARCGKKGANFNEGVNFLNRDEFLKFLNERANEVTDNKELTDVLKMISDNLRFKDSDKEGENEQIKAYLPIVCESCELYKRCKSCNLSVCPVAD